MRGRNTYTAKVTDSALGTNRFLESTVHGLGESAVRLSTAIGDARKRAAELEGRVGAVLDLKDRYLDLSKRRGEIEDKLDLTKNQGPSVPDSAGDHEIRQNRIAVENRALQIAVDSADRRQGLRV